MAYDLRLATAEFFVLALTGSVSNTGYRHLMATLVSSHHSYRLHMCELQGLERTNEPRVCPPVSSCVRVLLVAVSCVAVLMVMVTGHPLALAPLSLHRHRRHVALAAPRSWCGMCGMCGARLRSQGFLFYVTSTNQ